MWVKYEDDQCLIILNASVACKLAFGHLDISRFAHSCSSRKDRIQVSIFSCLTSIRNKASGCCSEAAGSACEKLTHYYLVPVKPIILIHLDMVASFLCFFSQRLKISPDGSTEKNKLSSCIYTEEEIFLIVFAIPSHVMTSIFIILHGVSWFKKLSLPAVSVKRFSGAILGKSNSAFKCCIFADII